MRGARAFLVLSASILVGAGFSACGGRVAGDSSGDAGVDTAPTTTSTPTGMPTSTPTGTPVSCPTFRPINGTPCTRGLSCFYSCNPSVTTAVSAACPTGTWRTTVVETCGEPPPPPPDECSACVEAQCFTEAKACEVDPTGGCAALINCLNSCSSAECQNKCITDSRSDEGKALVRCVVDKCGDACSG